MLEAEEVSNNAIEFTYIVGLVTLLGTWLALRGLLFLAERLSAAPVPAGFYTLSTTMLRSILILIAGPLVFTAALVLCSPFLYGEQMTLMVLGALATGLYGIAAVVMNAPFFPLALHQRLFLPTQALLSAVFLMLFGGSFDIFFMTFAFAMIYALMWALCLSDRLHH